VLVDRMLREAPAWLEDDGLLVVEVGNSQLALADKYPDLPLTWIEFERGGDGVFCIGATDLKTHFAS